MKRSFIWSSSFCFSSSFSNEGFSQPLAEETTKEDTNKENEEEIKKLTAKLEELKKKRNPKPNLPNYEKISYLRKKEKESDERFAIKILPPAPTEKEKYQQLYVNSI